MRLIRQPRDSDWPIMAETAEAAHREMPLPGKFCRKSWVKNWLEFSHMDAALILVQEFDGKPLGCLTGALSVDPATEEICAVMMFWHLDRSIRGHGFELLKAWRQMAKDSGATRLTMNHLNDSISSRLGAVYRRMGLRSLETIYTGEL